MKTKIVHSGVNGERPEPTATELHVRFDTLIPKRAYVRFDTLASDAPVRSFYLRRDGWEALGEPELVTVTIRPA